MPVKDTAADEFAVAETFIDCVADMLPPPEMVKDGAVRLKVPSIPVDTAARLPEFTRVAAFMLMLSKLAPAFVPTLNAKPETVRAEFCPLSTVKLTSWAI